LVGEKDPHARGALTAALAGLAADGHEVCVAGVSGPLARPACGSLDTGDSAFDVIVWALEAGPPPALARRLRDPATARALILVSGAGRLATAVEAQRLGATAILARPVDPAELRRAVESALGGA
jgi:ActR/RegA family two-component response regulator